MASSFCIAEEASRQPSRLWKTVVDHADAKAATETLLPVDISAEFTNALADLVDAANPPEAPLIDEAVQTALPPVGSLPEARNWPEFNRRYRILGNIEDGGMARVLLARQHALARDVAVKVLQHERSVTTRLLIRAEALVTAFLEHPNIVPVYDAADDCLVMRRVRGGSMGSLIIAHPEIDRLRRLVEVILRACDGIAFAHSRGIIHRDIKADNIMVGEFGEVLVVDWGLALAVAPAEDGLWHAPRLDRCPNVCSGTPGCVPPEIARGLRDEVGYATDLHMLGGMLYNCMSGRMPFDHKDKMEALVQAAANDFVPVEELAPDSPARLVEACRRAMAGRPDKRGTISEFTAALRTWLGREEVRNAVPTALIEREPTASMALSEDPGSRPLRRG